MPLVFWCLEQGFIPADAYLAWARETYQLPVLDNAFFLSGMDRADMPADRNAGPWTVACFPVGHWDGLTYLACVEPPREVPTGQYVFVLADPRAMSAAWNDLPSSVSAVASLSFDMPEGLASKAVKPFQLNFDEASLMGNADPNAKPKPAPAPSQPRVIATNEVKVPSSTKTAAPAKLDMGDLAEPEAMPPPPPPVKAPLSAGMDPEQQEIDLAFRTLKEHFTSSMLMKIDGNYASLYRWSSEFDLAAVANQCKVDLSGPSLFRIVAKTKLPYHGFVVDSPAHRDFFKQIGYDDLPASVTAVPIKIEDELWGLLLSLGTQAASRAKPLQAAETAVEKLKEALAGVWKPAA
jgi:hypothetical protein